MSKLEKIGVIVSNKMEKSVVVEVAYRYRHPMYSKIVVRTKRYMAHDKTNECAIGDKVILETSKPISKKKRWKIKQILNKALLSN